MANDYRIELDGHLLDAVINVEPRGIILESRGGTGAYARNPHYSAAFETILARSLGPFSNLERVLLASRDAVRLFPDAASRVLAGREELVALGPAVAASAIRARMRDFGKPAGNHVGNSTKRLRFEFGPGEFVQQLKLHRVEGPERAPNSDQRQGTVAEIHAAAPGSLPLSGENDDRRWIEGHPKRVAHLRRERAPGLARDKKGAVFAATGKLACEECGFEPAKKYGPAFLDAGLDVHHRVPLADLSPGTETMLADLALLCATCHRIEHRKIALAKAN